MMVMAMLGFYFEVARHDRDKHIRVHRRHIRPDKLHHFEKIREDATFALPYDYKSATHPAWQFWRKIGKTGISTVATYKTHDPSGDIMKSLGQNHQLFSELDLVKINSVYGVDCFLTEEQRQEKEKKEARAADRERETEMVLVEAKENKEEKKEEDPVNSDIEFEETELGVTKGMLLEKKKGKEDTKEAAQEDNDDKDYEEE